VPGSLEFKAKPALTQFHPVKANGGLGTFLCDDNPRYVIVRASSRALK
jgi:hypothetical protein